MHLTPGAATEPPRPGLPVGIHFWHPRTWDIHFWIGADGLPTISPENPADRGGGLRLPSEAFFYVRPRRKE
ncbi:MAG: hypothetical protein ACREV5_05395 [Steroidobacter sp.]